MMPPICEGELQLSCESRRPLSCGGGGGGCEAVSSGVEGPEDEMPLGCEGELPLSCEGSLPS